MSEYKGNELAYYSSLKFALEDGMVDQKEFRFLKELRAQMGISADVHSKMEMEIRDTMGETAPKQGTQNISDSVISKSTIIGTKVEVSQNALGNIENHYDRMIDSLQSGNMIAAKSAYDDAKLVDVDEAKAYFQKNGKEIARCYSLIANSYAIKLGEVSYVERADSYGIWEVDYVVESEIERIRNDYWLARGNADAFYVMNFELYETCLAGVNLYLNDPEWHYYKRVGIGGMNAASSKGSFYVNVNLDYAKKVSSFFYGHCISLINSSEDYDKDLMLKKIDEWVKEFIRIFPPCNGCKGAGKETNTCQNCRGKGTVSVSSGFLGLGSSQERCSNCNGSGMLIKTGGRTCNSCKGWKLNCSEVESEITPYPIDDWG